MRGDAPDQDKQLKVLPSLARSPALSLASSSSHLLSFHLNIPTITMPLSPPLLRPYYSTVPDLLQAINEHAGLEGYAVVLQRTKKSKQDIMKKVWIICDRGRQPHNSTGRQRRHTSTRHTGCPFKITASVEEGTAEPWYPEILNETHNHASTEASAHPVLRRMAMSSTRDEVTRQLAIQTAPAQILSAIRFNDPNAENAMVSRRNIYNLAAEQRRQELGPLTPIQALVRELDGVDWISEHRKDYRDQITHLFFVRRSQQFLLRKNHKVLVLDCTYKTNRFKLPLAVMSGQTALHTTFYVAFAFIAKEKTDDYTWIMERLKHLYLSLDLSAPVVMVTDMERGLMNAISESFPRPTTNHLLCIWHINTNVTANCKRAFATNEAWEKFYTAWKQVVYASTETEYNEAWDFMNDTYNLDLEASECMTYLWETYLKHHRRRFVKCYTNKL